METFDSGNEHFLKCAGNIYPSPLFVLSRLDRFGFGSAPVENAPFGKFIYGRINDQEAARALGDGKLTVEFVIGLLADCDE